MSAAIVWLSAACCGKSPQPDGTVGQAQTQSSSGSLIARPHVTLVALSDWQGVIKPCGCVEELQRGGIERTAAWLEKLRARDDSVVVVHAGALLTEDESLHPAQGDQRLIRARAFSRMIDKLDVAAVALSQDDLRRGGETVKQALSKGQYPLIATGWTSPIRRAVPHRLLKTKSGVGVGLFALSGKVGDRAALVSLATDQVKALRAKGAQVVVALSDLPMRTSRRVVRAVEGIDVLVLGRVPPKTEPTEEGEIDGDAWILMPPRHGAYMAQLTLTPGGQGSWQDATAWLPGAATAAAARVAKLKRDLERWRGPGQSVATQRSLPFFERQLRLLERSAAQAQIASGKPLPAGKLGGYRSVGLAWTSPTAPVITSMVKDYDRRVGELNEKKFQDPPQAKEGQARYVGEAVCGACHQPALQWAAHDAHHHAWETLQKAGKTRDLDCVPCHVTGWMRPGGSAFSNLETFQRVQCEACHGPGSLHVASPVKKGPKSQIVRSPGQSVCTGCHSPEHAPRFSFRAYVPKLRAPGHGLPVTKRSP